jgi:DNA primase
MLDDHVLKKVNLTTGEKEMSKKDLTRLIEDVKQRTDIVQVIDSKISLNKNNMGTCPFHEDHNPSLSVHHRDQYFYCFGCGITGDVFKFLEMYEDRPFWEVLRDCSEHVGISFPNLHPKERYRIEVTREVRDILTETARFYHKNITSEARDYLRDERGISEEIISRFMIGFANGKLRDHLIEKCKFPEEMCIKAGVLKKGQDNNLRDFFFKRVIFPNLRFGNVVHLTGRSLDESDPKYLHLPGEIRYLYNEQALGEEEIIITEGVFDCLSAVQMGYAAVCTFGSNLKTTFLSKFEKCGVIYLCFDADEAGKKATLAAGEKLWQKASIIQLPDGYDLNEYFKQSGEEKFKALYCSALDFVTSQIRQIPTDIDKKKLSIALKPILEKLCEMDGAMAEAYLTGEIGERFKLKSNDLTAYRKMMTKKAKKDEKDGSSEIISQPTAYFEGLVDLVLHEGRPAFLIRSEEGLIVRKEVTMDGKFHVPPSIEQIPWLLPKAEKVVEYYQSGLKSMEETDAKLYDDLYNYHKSISELPKEEYYDIIVAWDFHTYLQEAFQYTPIICFFAVAERGKSRTGKAMTYVAYRGLHVESLREAYIFRVAQNFKSSLFFDIMDVWKKASEYRCEDILLSRFEKGIKVARVLYPDRGAFADTVYYSIFGPTIIATNVSIHSILDSRSITISMPESSRKFDSDVKESEALSLKERLVAFRARYLNTELPTVSKPAKGRLGDILRPLLQIITLVNSERKEKFLKALKHLQARRSLERLDSFEAKVLRAVDQLDPKVSGGVLPVKMITDRVNEDKPDHKRFSPQRIGKVLDSLGFDKGRTATGSSAIIWDHEKIKRMKSTYGIEVSLQRFRTKWTDLVLRIRDTFC